MPGAFDVDVDGDSHPPSALHITSPASALDVGVTRTVLRIVITLGAVEIVSLDTSSMLELEFVYDVERLVLVGTNIWVLLAIEMVG